MFNKLHLIVLILLSGIFIQAFSQSYHLVIKDSIIVDTSVRQIVDIILSPDGNDVYVPNQETGKIEWFSVNKSTGALTRNPDYSSSVPLLDGDKEINDLAISPDGKFLYVVNMGPHSDSLDVLILSRDTATGRIGDTYSIYDNRMRSTTLMISPDGENAYGSGSYSLFFNLSRNTETGELTFIDTTTNGLNGGSVEDPMVISPDGQFVYTTSYSSNALSTFFYSPWTQSMYPGTILQGSGSDDKLFEDLTDLAITPDGKYLYAFAVGGNKPDGDIISLYERDSASGELTLVKYYEQDIDFDNLYEVNTVKISNDGTKLIIPERYGNFSLFTIDPATGELTFEMEKSFGKNYENPLSVNFSTDDKYVYTTLGGAVVCFAIDTTPPIEIINPAAGDTVHKGLDYSITWDEKHSDTIDVHLFLLDKDDNIIDTIVMSTDNDGEYTWFVDWSLDKGEYKFKILSKNLWEKHISEIFIIDSFPTPDEITDNNNYYEDVAVANNSDVTSDVWENQITLNHGNIYTVFKRGSGSSAADKEVKISIIDKDGNVDEKDITCPNNASVYKPLIASTQSSVVAMYRYYDGSDYKVCVARSDDNGQNFTLSYLGDYEVDALISDGVSRYYLRDEYDLHYSLDDGKSYQTHKDFNFYERSQFHAKGDNLWIVNNVSSDSLRVYKANKNDLTFNLVAAWAYDPFQAYDYSSAVDDNKCVVYYEHEEVGTYYLRTRTVNGNTLEDEVNVTSNTTTKFDREKVFIDNDTLYFVSRRGAVTRYFNNSFESLNLDMDEDVQSSTYDYISNVWYRGNGMFYGHTELTSSGSKNNLTVWYWNYHQESPIVPNLSNAPVKFSLNASLSNGSSKLHLSVGIPNIENGNLNVKLFNLSGRVTKNINYGINKTGYLKESIDISTLANGMYLMKVKLGDRVLNNKLPIRR